MHNARVILIGICGTREVIKAHVNFSTPTLAGRLIGKLELRNKSALAAHKALSPDLD